MSTSIAEVTCAEVSSERRMCSAMPFRIGDIGLEGLALLGGRRGLSRRSRAQPERPEPAQREPPEQRARPELRVRQRERRRNR